MKKASSGVAAIVITLSILAGILILAFAVAFLSTTNVQIAGNLRANTQTRYVAEAGIDYVAANLIYNQNTRKVNPSASHGKTYLYTSPNGDTASIKVEVSGTFGSVTDPQVVKLKSTGKMAKDTSTALATSGAEYVAYARINSSNIPCLPSQCVKRKGIVSEDAIDMTGSTFDTFDTVACSTASIVHVANRAALPAIGDGTKFYQDDSKLPTVALLRWDISQYIDATCSTYGGGAGASSYDTNGQAYYDKDMYSIQSAKTITGVPSVSGTPPENKTTAQSNMPVTVASVAYTNKVDAAIAAMGSLITVSGPQTIGSQSSFDNTYKNKSTKINGNLIVCRGVNISSGKLWATGNVIFNTCGTGTNQINADALVIAHDPNSTTAKVSTITGLSAVSQIGGYPNAAELYADGNIKFEWGTTVNLDGQGSVYTRGDIMFVGTAMGTISNRQPCPTPSQRPDLYPTTYNTSSSPAGAVNIYIPNPSDPNKTYCLPLGTPISGTPPMPAVDGRGAPVNGEVWNQGWNFNAEGNITVTGSVNARAFMKADGIIGNTSPCTAYVAAPHNISPDPYYPNPTTTSGSGNWPNTYDGDVWRWNSTAADKALVHPCFKYLWDNTLASELSRGSFRLEGGGLEAKGAINLQQSGALQVQTRWEDDIWKMRYYPEVKPTYIMVSRK